MSASSCVSRYASLASIVAAVFAPFYQLLVWGTEPMFLPIIVISVLLVWRHEANIRKLLAGKESKIGQAADAAAAAHPPRRTSAHRKGH